MSVDLDQRQDELLRVSEAAQRFKLSEATIRRLVRRGELAGQCIGRSIRVYADQPDSLVNPSQRGPVRDRARLR